MRWPRMTARMREEAQLIIMAALVGLGLSMLLIRVLAYRGYYL